MTQFVLSACTDIRHGRESWRVYLMFSVPALATGFLAGLVWMA